jgi:hypothetical protein
MHCSAKLIFKPKYLLLVPLRLDKAKEMIEGANTAEHILFVHSISTD